MNKYFVLHTIKTSVEELEMAMEGAPELARSMAAGETPAKCLKTWDPTPHGRTDYVFCLWEAEKHEDIEASLGTLNEILTADIMQVDEVDWAALAQVGG